MDVHILKRAKFVGPLEQFWAKIIWELCKIKMRGTDSKVGSVRHRGVEYQNAAKSKGLWPLGCDFWPIPNRVYVVCSVPRWFSMETRALGWSDVFPGVSNWQWFSNGHPHTSLGSPLYHHHTRCLLGKSPSDPHHSGRSCQLWSLSEGHAICGRDCRGDGGKVWLEMKGGSQSLQSSSEV